MLVGENVLPTDLQSRQKKAGREARPVQQGGTMPKPGHGNGIRNIQATSR